MTDAQPQAQAPMMVQPGGNRNAKNLPVGPNGREWSHGLFSCCDDPMATLVACCVPCVSYGVEKQRFDSLQNDGVPARDPGIVSGDCCLNMLLLYGGCWWIQNMLNRGHIRQRYNIEGGGLGDCFVACFCTPCELVQESREIELEEQSLGHSKE